MFITRQMEYDEIDSKCLWNYLISLEESLNIALRKPGLEASLNLLPLHQTLSAHRICLQTCILYPGLTCDKTQGSTCG